MGSKVTFGRLIGLIVIVAALGSAPATAGNTPQGLKADGLRLQAMANAYKDRSAVGNTPQGLRADGLRLQAIANSYKQQHRPAASFYTPQALRAEGLRWQAMADAYRAGRTPSRSASSSSSNGFDWSAALVGAGSMLGFGTVGGALLLGARRVRRTKVAV